MDKFIAGVQTALPGHLHRFTVMASAFDDADLNGKNMSRIIENLSLWFLTGPDTNGAVQPQKMVFDARRW